MAAFALGAFAYLSYFVDDENEQLQDVIVASAVIATSVLVLYNLEDPLETFKALFEPQESGEEEQW